MQSKELEISFPATDEIFYVTNLRIVVFIAMKIAIMLLAILSFILLSELNNWDNIEASVLRVMNGFIAWGSIAAICRGIKMRKWYYRITETGIEDYEFYITRKRKRIISFNRIVAITSQQDWMNRVKKTKGVSFHTAGSKAPNIDILDIMIDQADTYTGET